MNESQLQTYESKTLFLMTSLQYYCIPGLAEIKTYAQKMQDAQVTKSLERPIHCYRYTLRPEMPDSFNDIISIFILINVRSKYFL